MMMSRYGKIYKFIQEEENLYRFEGDMNYCRMGGKENTDTIDYNDLGFFDPSGGPFISKGFSIDEKKVKRIMSTKNGVFFEVE